MSLQLKIVLAIVVALIAIGIGMAAQRGVLQGSGESSVADIFGIKNVPSLTRSVKYSSDIAPDVKQTLEKHVADLRATLKENDTDYEAWLTLAIRYKQAGDLDKAREIWEYLASIHPDDVVPRHNLGDLYHHFLNDYTKAEMYYKQALELSPMNALDYLALYELYRYSLKQDTAAVDILKEGIGRVTENQPIDLYIALANFYVAKGDTSEAIANFTKARDLAQKTGNTSLVTQLNAEIAQLREP